MENRVFNIGLAHHYPLVMAGIASFLSGRSDLKVVFEAHDRIKLTEALDVKSVDLLIVDHAIPGSITLDELQHLIRESKVLHVLIISADDNRDAVRRAFKMGVKGFINQDCSKEELLVAVQATAKGEKFFSSKILNIILNEHTIDREEESSILTARETEILQLLAQGQSTQKIADALHLSPHTVQTHRKSIIRKLKIKSPTQFVIHALDLGLIKQK
jgi:DNA-binding NarL/FixJ family response regulator